MKRSRYIESKQKQYEYSINLTLKSQIKSMGPDFPYPQLKVLPVGFVLILPNYSRFENDIVYAKIHYMGFLNLKFNMHDPEAFKDISGDYIKIGDDYMSVNNSTILKNNDFLQIITDIDYFDKTGFGLEDERMIAFTIHDPRNGTPPYSETVSIPNFKDPEFDLRFLNSFFSSTTNKIYAIPQYLRSE